jgi:methionine synthase I (cobalamin-dependent)
VTPLEQALRERVLLLNTSTVDRTRQKDFQPLLPLTHPEHVLDWSRQLVNAGSDIVEARTWDADALSAQEYPVDSDCLPDWNREAVRIAREAADGQKYVVGAVSQGLSLLTVMPRHSFDEHVGAVREQVRHLWQAGVDAIHLVFFIDARNVQAAFMGIDAVQQEVGCRIPTMLTLDLPFPGTLLSGHRIDQVWSLIAAYKPIALGIASYGYGGEELRRVREVADVPLGLLLDVCHGEPASWLVEILEPLLAARLLSYCGLSCTVPSLDYVRTVAALLKTSRPATRPGNSELPS